MINERRFDAAHKKALSRGQKGHEVSDQTREKISRKMAGKSNFKGKQHTERAKQAIGDSRGHDDRIDGKKWKLNKHTDKTSREYSLGNTDTYEWGRVAKQKKVKRFNEWTNRDPDLR